MENKNVSQNSGSNFASIPGLLILVFFLALSCYFKANIISAFLLLFLILCLIAFLWSRSTSGQLHGKLESLTPGVFPGDEIQLNLKLSNTGHLSAIWVDAYLPLPEKQIASWQNGQPRYVEMKQPAWSGEALQQKFTWLMPHQELCCTLNLKAQKRGLLTFDRIYLQTGDGFGISARSHADQFPAKSVTAIYPKLYPVNLCFFRLRGTRTDTGNRGEYEDVTLLKNIRPYAPGDQFKRINWRMLAKQNEMQVNIYEKITPKSIVFLLDLKSFETMRHTEGGADDDMTVCTHEESLELAISLTASCILGLSEEGVSCSLLLPGYGNCRPRIYEGTNRSRQAGDILMLLTELSYDGGAVSWTADEQRYLNTVSGQIYAITYQTPDPALLLSEAAQKMKFICMNSENTDLNTGSIPASDILGGTYE